MTSIRYRLVWRLLGLSNEVSKRCMEYLSRHKVHSQAGRHFNNWSVVSVGMNRSHGQVHNTVVDPVLRDQIDKHHASVCVPNLPLRALDQHRFSGLNDHLFATITHDGPLFPADLNSPRSVQYGRESSAPASPKRTRKAEAAE